MARVKVCEFSNAISAMMTSVIVKTINITEKAIQMYNKVSFSFTQPISKAISVKHYIICNAISTFNIISAKLLHSWLGSIFASSYPLKNILLKFVRSINISINFTFKSKIDYS